MQKTDFETIKDASLAHTLIKMGRLVNERGLAIARKKFKLHDLKQSHLDLFPFIDFGGTSISEIAERKEVSKQAISKTVQEMVDMGLLILKKDSKDRRSKLVFFKTKGKHSIQNGFKALQIIDEELKESVGVKSYETTTIALLKIMKQFDKD